ncbi:MULTISPECIES: hypothetical protein [unclassified Streptomyces]|jgi:hypothetical protein|uniref:hypothetical protein n=1 Tax=unclassified Streptomyces TaxID=2593676 RepID=UPI000710E5BA|nr:hypothetical protein [Streptomyces sp. Root1310]KQX62280.1 hypothetical protein ASD48_27040 [Streptomyces sp. Root1310]
MIGLVIRVLPFWVREPLLVVVGVPFSGLLFYAAIRDQEWIGAALGLAVAVFTAVRIHTIRRALQTRRQLKAMEGVKRIEGI